MSLAYVDLQDLVFLASVIPSGSNTLSASSSEGRDLINTSFFGRLIVPRSFILCVMSCCRSVCVVGEGVSLYSFSSAVEESLSDVS